MTPDWTVALPAVGVQDRCHCARGGTTWHQPSTTPECEHHDAFKGEDMSKNHPEGWVGLNRADTNFNGSLQTTLQELAGDHPWIPGATFRSNPGLAQYLIECIHRWEPPRHDDAVNTNP